MSAQAAEHQWLAGDSHIHSHWSADYDETTNPPEPSIGVDGRYATPVNAYRARQYGLDWMVTTDHGGPNHSKLNFSRAYPELNRDGEAVTITTTLPQAERSGYVRVRGTNTQDLEPPMDVRGENPWADLWFYSNPVFIEVSAPASD